MDRVRFGRALGNGTREAAKALARAADAALAPNPSQGTTQAAPSGPSASRPAAQPAQPQLRTLQQAIPSREDVRRGGQRFGQSVFQPFARASSVLWFEFTGTFFGLFAVAMALETWKQRHLLRPENILEGHAWLAPALMLVFAYFTVSSFVRASRRSRR